MKRSGALSVSLALSLLLSSSLVWAAPTFQQRKEAQQLIQEAKGLVQKGDFKKAAQKYKKADDVAPAPSTKLELAKLLIELGDLKQASEILDKAIAEKPGQWVEKQSQTKAQALRKEVDERMPTLSVTIVKPESGSVSVTVDGEDFEPADGAVGYNPGSYELVAEAPGYQPFRKPFELKDGDRKTIKVNLSQAGGGADVAKDDGGGLSVVPGIVALGVGAVGLGVGTGFGIAAVNSTNDLLILYDCEDAKCPKEAEEDLDRAKLNGNVSTAGFIIGGVGVVAGTVLVIIAVTGDDEAPKSELRSDDGTLQLEARPILGPGYVGIDGRF